MNNKIKKNLKRIERRPIDPLLFRLRQLENTKILYEQNYNLQPNVRMANILLVQNDIAVFKKRLKKSRNLGVFLSKCCK